VSRYLIDTNLLIDHLRGDLTVEAFLRDVESGRVRATISVIPECARLASPILTLREERRVRTLLTLFPSVAVTSHSAQRAAQLRRRYRITIADALIAATAFQSHATFLTRNVKDVQPIRELHVQTL